VLGQLLSGCLEAGDLFYFSSKFQGDASMAKLGAVWLSAIILGFSVVGCEPVVQGDADGNNIEGAPAQLDPASEAKSGDQTVTEDLLADKETFAEAKDWLSPKHENHSLWKGDKKAITKLVDDLYEAGAVKVYAVGFDKEDKVQVVAMFVAELPKDAAARKKVFKTHNKFWKEYLSDEDEEELKEFMEKDNGQKYIVLNFDL
jgi:hypothetical protein